jgi:hypothetical protein
VKGIFRWKTNYLLKDFVRERERPSGNRQKEREASSAVRGHDVTRLLCAGVRKESPHQGHPMDLDPLPPFSSGLRVLHSEGRPKIKKRNAATTLFFGCYKTSFQYRAQVNTFSPPVDILFHSDL